MNFLEAMPLAARIIVIVILMIFVALWIVLPIMVYQIKQRADETNDLLEDIYKEMKKYRSR